MGLGQFRAQSAVALELGTVYAYDEVDVGNSRVYAFDINTGALKWKYEVKDIYGGEEACVNANTPAGGKNCYPPPIPGVFDIDPLPTPGRWLPVTAQGCFNEPEILLMVSAWDWEPAHPTPTTPAFAGNIDLNAPDFRVAGGVDVINLTTGVQMHWPCTSEFCSGMVDLVLGVNQIVVTTYDLAGKRGSTRIRIERKTLCP